MLSELLSCTSVPCRLDLDRLTMQDLEHWHKQLEHMYGTSSRVVTIEWDLHISQWNLLMFFIFIHHCPHSTISMPHSYTILFTFFSLLYTSSSPCHSFFPFLLIYFLPFTPSLPVVLLSSPMFWKFLCSRGKLPGQLRCTRKQCDIQCIC